MSDDDVNRRQTLKLIAAAGAAATTAAAAATGCSTRSRRPEENRAMARTKNEPAAADPTQDPTATATAADAVLAVRPLGFPWQTSDPFIFCVHHDDRYPAGNDRMGPPASSLVGRNLGQDFEIRDGWRMYHGEVVPGFPQHPHRGFETVTVVRRGLLDHSDSLGAAARYGGGDVQWLTAGRGILHAEMFPLVHRDAANPLELFQIWLNLPAKNKMVDPYFSMLWNESIPRVASRDAAGLVTEVTLVAGRYGEQAPPAPPPNSWAARADADVAIWTIKMAPGARWVLPAAAPGSNRSLYFFRGSGLDLGGRSFTPGQQIELRADRALALESHGGSGFSDSEMLILQGRPISEPVVQYGPFVMNTQDQIREAFADYQRTRFGGWPWPSDDPVHPRAEGRFARHIGGRLERPV